MTLPFPGVPPRAVLGVLLGGHPRAHRKRLLQDQPPVQRHQHPHHRAQARCDPGCSPTGAPNNTSKRTRSLLQTCSLAHPPTLLPPPCPSSHHPGAGTTYQFEVWAQNERGQGSPRSTTGTTLNPQPTCQQVGPCVEAQKRLGPPPSVGHIAALTLVTARHCRAVIPCHVARPPPTPPCHWDGLLCTAGARPGQKPGGPPREHVIHPPGLERSRRRRRLHHPERECGQRNQGAWTD